jgi:hypothetical protein
MSAVQRGLKIGSSRRHFTYQPFQEPLAETGIPAANPLKNGLRYDDSAVRSPFQEVQQAAAPA